MRRRGRVLDPFGPGVWDATPDTLVIFSASRAEYLGRVSAVDIASDPVTPLPLEAPGVTGNWDFTIADGTAGLQLVPAGAFAGLDSRARVAVLPGRDFDEVSEAPSDTASFTAAPVPLRPGDVYVIRSRRASCGVSSGFRYAKLKPVEIDVARGTLRFAIVRNPFCDNRSFVPPRD